MCNVKDKFKSHSSVTLRFSILPAYSKELALFLVVLTSVVCTLYGVILNCKKQCSN